MDVEEQTLLRPSDRDERSVSQRGEMTRSRRLRHLAVLKLETERVLQSWLLGR